MGYLHHLQNQGKLCLVLRSWLKSIKVSWWIIIVWVPSDHSLKIPVCVCSWWHIQVIFNTSSGPSFEDQERHCLYKVSSTVCFRDLHPWNKVCRILLLLVHQYELGIEHHLLKFSFGFFKLCFRFILVIKTILTIWVDTLPLVSISSQLICNYISKVFSIYLCTRLVLYRYYG